MKFKHPYAFKIVFECACACALMGVRRGHWFPGTRVTGSVSNMTGVLGTEPGSLPAEPHPAPVTYFLNKNVVSSLLLTSQN